MSGAASVYHIGISITMQNGVSAVLSLIQRQLLGLNGATQRAAAGFARLRFAIAGATVIAIGDMAIKGIADLVKHGEKYTHELEAMKVAGMGVVEMQSAIAEANRVSSSVMISTPTQNLKTIQELRMALASADVRPGGKADPAMATVEAVRHLETFQKITAIMSSTLSKNGKPFDGAGQAYELAKSAEMLGLSQNAKKFDDVLEGWTKAIISSGGKLQGSDFFGNVKYMRGSGMGMSMEFLTEILPSLMQEFKTAKGSGAGGGAGNPLASLFANVVGGQLSKKSIMAYERLGMLNPKDVISEFGTKTVRPGAIVGSDVASQNFYEFAKILLSHLQKTTNYLDKDKQTGEFLHPAQLRAEIAAITPNRVAQQMLSILAFQQNRIEGDRSLQRAAWGIDPAFAELQRKDPVLVREEIWGRDGEGGQLDRLKTDLGKSIAPEVTEMLYQFARGLKYLSEVVEAHPTATAWFFKIAAGLAVMFVVLGSITLAIAAFGAIFSAGPALLAIAAITALGVAISYLWDSFRGSEIRKALQSLGNDFVVFWHALQMYGKGITFAELGRAIKGAFAIPIDWVAKNIESLQKQILDGLAGLLKSLGAWFAALPGRLLSSLTNPSASAAPDNHVITPGEVARWPNTPGVPPSAANNNAPGSSPSNPIYNTQLNQPSGKDIAHGVSDFQGRQIHGPSTGPTGFDQRSGPSFSLYGTP